MILPSVILWNFILTVCNESHSSIFVEAARGGGGGGPLSTKDLLQTPGKRKPLMAGGGKVKSKFFTGGTVNPSFGTDFDDR